MMIKNNGLTDVSVPAEPLGDPPVGVTAISGRVNHGHAR
jgi:hypothetical protein